MNFSEKRVIVTGGASGIGEAVVRKMLRLGAQVMISDIAPERGVALEKELQSANYKAFFCQTDVADAHSVAHSVALAAERFGGLDVLVNNAGIGAADALAEDIPVETYHKTIQVNLLGMCLNAKYALPHLRKSKGCIVNTASISGLVGTKNCAAYCASKSGVVGFTRGVASEYIQYGVRCNAVAPSSCETAMWGSLKRMTPEQRAATIARESGPIGRFCQPEEVADAILWLASEEAAFINGAILPVDGGYTAV